MPEPGKKKVLVVDDEQIIANTLTTILNHSGFEAQAAYSGENAIELARALQPDLLISDVVMQGISGIEAAVEVRSFLPSCKILLFSGQAATAELLEKARVRRDDFEILAKPVHPTELLARIRSAVSA